VLSGSRLVKINSPKFNQPKNMKPYNSSKKRSALALAAVAALSTQAWVMVLSVCFVFVCVVGSVYYLYTTVIREVNVNNNNPQVNQVQVYPYIDEWEPYGFIPPIPAPFYPMLSLASANAPFSFQYGLCSSNDTAAVWVGMTNLTPAGWVTTNWQNDANLAVQWSLADTSNYWDFIYQVDGHLGRCTTTLLSNGQYVVVNANLTLVIEKSTSLGAGQWQPIYTNTLPQLDNPATFTDINTTTPAAFYRVGYQ
jgi:hypothetical protein